MTEGEQSERLEENQEIVVHWKTEGRSVSGWTEWSVQASRRPVGSHIPDGAMIRALRTPH